MPLIAGVGQVDSAELSYAMWELSRSIQRAMNLHRGLPVSTLAAMDPTNGKRSRQLGTPPPNIALAAIDRMRLAREEADPRAHQQQRASERAEAAETLLS